MKNVKHIEKGYKEPVGNPRPVFTKELKKETFDIFEK